MRNKLRFLVYGITGMLFVFTFLYTSGNLQDLYSKFQFQPKDELHSEVVSSSGDSKGKVPFVAYIPNKDNSLLEPQVLDINPKGDIYKNLINSLMSSSKEFFKGEYKLSSIEREGKLIKVKLSSSFKEALSLDEKRFNLSLMSIVNTLSEINNIEYVEIYSGKDKIDIKGVDKFQRNPSFINLEKFDSPEKVLREQMKLEQKGEFLKAYLLMSSKHSKGRKMYYEYLKEMEDIRSVGFLNGDFKIKDTSIKGDEATLNVEFINVSQKGDAVNTSLVPVKCLHINGTWVVDWY